MPSLELIPRHIQAAIIIEVQTVHISTHGLSYFWQVLAEAPQRPTRLDHDEAFQSLASFALDAFEQESVV